MTRSIVKVGLAALLLALVPSLALAQGGATSSITGIVEDTQGGVIPGALATASHDATGVKYTAYSAGDGGFTIPSIPIGTYTVTVTLQGFKNAVLKGVTVSAASPANVRAKLEVGGLSETVTVEAASAMIQTQTSVAATTINTNQILNLPVGSRNTLDFVQFLPGVQTTGGVRDSTVAGLPQSTIAITVDGVSVQDNFLKTTDGFFARMSPRLDSVEEVTLTTAAQGADASGQGATQIKFTTRSGTNQYVTSLYHFYQNDRLNSNSYSNRVRGLPKGPETLYQGGGRIGGPLVLPGVYDGRGKAFFFTNYEHLYEPDTTTTTSILMLPHAQTGLFRYPGNPAGVNVLALAAANGLLSTPDPVIAQLLTDIRNSTASGAVGVFSAVTGDLNVERYQFQQKAESNNKFPTVRLDYNINDKHRLSFSTNRNYILSTPDTTNTRTRTFPGFPNFGEQASVRYQITTTLRSTLGANLVNEFRLGGSGGPTQFSPSINVGMFTGPLANQAGYDLNISTFNNVNNQAITDATRSTSRSSREPTTRTVENTLTWLKGSHSISTGFSYTGLGAWLDSGNETTTINFDVLDGDPARAIFNNTANFPGSTGNDRTNARALYAVLVGSVSSVSGTARRAVDGDYVYNGRSFQEGRLRQYDTFFQDSWRIRPNLSVNLGLRYALQPSFFPLNSSYSGATVNEIWGISGFVPGCEFRDPVGTGCNIFKPGVTPGTRPFYSPLDGGTKIYKTDKDNIAPSLGVNYTPDLGRVAGLRTIFGAQSESSFSAGWVRSYSRLGMDSFTGRLDNNPGLNLDANRTVGNGNLGALPLYFRNGYLGGPPKCSESNNATGCMIDRPTYPFFNNNDTGSITMFDPNIQIEYADTYTAAWQRQVSRNFSAEIRYVGTRGNDFWSLMDYNEDNIHSNGFVDEFRLAQQNLVSHIAAGCGQTGAPVCSFAYRGAGTGTSPLPTYLAYFSGLPSTRASDASVYTSTNWTSGTFVNDLGLYTANVFNAAGDLQDDATRRANAITAGLPANFFVANPNMLGGAQVVTNDSFTRYNSMQLQLRRRLANGFSFDMNYVYGKGWVSNFDSFRVARVLEPDTDDVRHAFKGNWIFQVPVGRGKRFGTDMNAWLDGFAGGWMFSGTFRIQSGNLQDLGNIRVVGMTHDEVRDLFNHRQVSPDIAYTWPQDIIDETIKAFSTSATSATGYGALGPPSGRYFAPASNPGCFETISTDRGDCGVRSLIVRGPMRFQMDWSFRKNIPFGGRRVFELSVDIFNPFNFVQWGGDLGLSTTLANWQPGLPGSRRTMQIGTRFTF
jgi:hypothetical protein